VVEPISTAIAALALIVSTLAAIYSRRQALAAQVQAKELRDLQHKRERPRIEVSAESIGTGVFLAVTNADLYPVDSAEVELSAVRNDGAHTTRTKALADTQSWTSGSLGRFQGARTSVSLAGLNGGQIAVVVMKAKRGNLHWEWLAEVPVPSSDPVQPGANGA
jgi:hypothetical protein